MTGKIIQCPECGKNVVNIIDCRSFYDFFHNIVPDIKKENMLICKDCYLYIVEEIKKLAKKWV